MKQQTAVDYLIKQISEILGPLKTEGMTDLLLVDAIQKAKQMEKEQISKAWDDGNYQYFCSVRTNEDFDNGYEYYEEQYKSE